MEIWQFNDPEPLRPFLLVLENYAPDLIGSARRLFSPDLKVNREDLICLARGLVDIRPDVRQAVRILIFSPPIEEEIAHFSLLLQWLPDWLPPGWYEHKSLRGLVVELVSSLAQPRDCRPLGTVLEIILKRRLPSWRQEASLFSTSLEPSIRRSLLSVIARRLPHPLRSVLKNRFFLEETLSLGQICEALVAATRLPRMGSHRYCRRTMSLVSLGSFPTLRSTSKRVREFSKKLDGGLRILSWDQRSKQENEFLEKLIHYQANELVEVFRLAKEVSRRTRRVVLTLHNASLGAATGWGAPSFAQQVPADNAAPFFERVNFLQKDFLAKLSGSCPTFSSSQEHSLKEQSNNLFRLWGKRLVKPRIFQALWTLRLSLILNGLPMDEWEQLYSQARALLDPKDHQRLIRGKGMAITFVPPTAASRNLQETLLWYQERKESHPQLFSLLWALIEVGQEWLRSNRLEHFVLPIIDKFFISSRRDQDLDYLPLFVQLASHSNYAPLFLLVDDTSRASHPSLQLAIDRWREHYDFLGLGIFGGERDPKTSPLETILAYCSKIKLFALRPLSQVHNPIPLDILLAQRPQDFLTPTRYDSSWKDNLPFLYHGTQVAPFSAGVKQTEQFYPALITSAGPMAFGTYYRSRLRQLGLAKLGLLGEQSQAIATHSSLDTLWRDYAQLANLL